MTSLARASRNNVLRVARRQRGSAISTAISARNTRAKLATMTAWSLAVKETKDLLPRPRGRFHWEPDMPVDEQRALTHEGDLLALHAYREEHKAELEASAKAMRDVAERIKQQDKKQAPPDELGVDRLDGAERAAMERPPQIRNG